MKKLGGLDSDVGRLTSIDKRIYETQQHLLESYEMVGTIKSSAKAAGINRSTHYQWLEDDKLGYRDRFKAVRETFREELEEILFTPGSETLGATR